MTTEDDDGKAEPTFTRAQMAKMVNAQVREKVAAALAEYGDLDELRAKAAESDKQKSQLDRIEEQLKASEARAAAAERAQLVREVADELGISVRLASKLEGKTKAELLADGKDTMDDLGIKPKSKTKSTDPKGDATDGDTDDSDGDDDAQQQEEEPKATRSTAPARTARPRENLRSGAPRTPAEPEETNPLKLVADIPRR
jgi:hypothetical protein